MLIGPHTADQLDGLVAADIDPPDHVLDPVDAIVPQGTDLNPDDDCGATPPALLDARLRPAGA